MPAVIASVQPTVSRASSGPAASASSVPQAQASSPNSASQDAAVAQVNQHLLQTQSDLKIQVDQGSGRTVFQVVQEGTGQVLYQMPSAEVLGMSRRVRELQAQSMNAGVLLDKQG
jgi:uncharacterized FlaG/YvyC family protein